MISVTQAAEILNITKQRVRQLIQNNNLPATKVGAYWTLDEDDVRRYGSMKALIPTHDHSNSSTKDKPIALSFFSGAMGLDLGIEKAGFDIRLACEMDKFCRQTIAINRPQTALLGDVSKLTPKEVIEAAGLTKTDDIDLIMGGPPCQAFSTAGKRKGFEDERGNVFLDYLDLAFELKPKYFVIENVRGLLSSPMKYRPHNQRGENFPPLALDELRGGALNFIISKIKNAGYSYSFELYNAANFGTPQTRERVVLIASRNKKKPPYIPPTHSQIPINGLQPWKTFKECIEGLTEHHHLDFPEKRLKYYRMLKPGEYWKSLPLDLQKEALGKSFHLGGGKTGFLRRLDWNKPSPTLVTHPAMPATDLCHPTLDRPLSVEEYKRIQQFPDEWQLAGPLVQQYKQLGNAVPVGMGYAIGKLLIKLLKGEQVHQISDFKYSRYKNTRDSDWEEKFWEETKKLNPPQLSLEV
jgi:DNA (cytosine-5)-methyltransferase 1